MYIKYGENTNLDLLVDYGFCMAQGNTDDFAEVLLDVPTADGMVRSVTVRCRYEGGIDEPGLASLRAALCTEPSSQFLPSYVATSDRRPGTNRGLAAMAAFPRPISEENERAVWHALVETLTIAKCEAEGHAHVHDGEDAGEGAGGGAGADPVVGIVASYRTARARILGRALEKLRQTRLSHRPSGAMGTAFLLRCHCFPYLRQCLTSRSSSGHCLSIVLPLLSFSKAVPLPCGPPPQPVRMGRRARWRRGPSAPTSTISNRTRG